MNEYYSRKADSINNASETRRIDREFAEAKKYNMHRQTSKLLVSKESLHKHFKKHFGGSNIPMPKELQHPENSRLKDTMNNAIDVDESPPHVDEIKKTLGKLKNGKCEGTDKVKMEQLKYGKQSDMFINHILTLLTLIWTSIIVPNLWIQSRISCIFKKGKQSDPANYRGISVTATLSRLIPTIIMNRISTAYNRTLEQTQFGFRRNKGCDNAIFILRNIIDRSSSTPMYISFIDFTAAYDKIPRNILFRVLDIRLGCHHIISLLKAIYTGTTAIVTASRKSFPIETGCRQGGIESPVLFNIYFDTVCRVLNYELKRVLGDDYGIKFSYRIPNEATSRTQRSKCRSNGISSIDHALYADDMYSMCIAKRNEHS